MRIHSVLQMGTQPELVGPCNTSRTYFFCDRLGGRLFSAKLLTAIDLACPKLLCLHEVIPHLCQFLTMHRGNSLAFGHLVGDT